MAQNSIEIFDDTVIKLTVNQGTEEERSEISTGNFSMGELAFVRDTGRVFVGDSSDDITLPTALEDGSLNYTKGGILVGNRYLGMIDSKPLVEIDTSEGGSNGTPLNYDTITPVKTEEGARLNERQLIKGNDAKFKKQMLIDSGDLVGRWDRKATYNKEYDAYNGDFVYDAYQNAIILFDKGITKDLAKQKTILDEDGKPYVDEDGVQIFHDENETEISDLEDKISVKRRTPFIEYEAQGSGASDNESAPKSNIYGDGYVIFRNIEPDNETLIFKQRSFDNDGKPSELNGPGYSHNVLTINKISTSNLAEGFFDTEQFNITSKVSIKPELAWATEIGTKNNSLTIPEYVSVKYGVDSEGNTKTDTFKMNQISLTNDEEAQILTLYRNQGEDVYNIKPRKPFEYKLNLGSGLVTGTGQKTLLLKYDNEETLELEDGISGASLGVKDPYSLYDNDITWDFITEKELYYNDNLTLFNGFINDVDTYEKEYADEAAEFISKYNSPGNVFTNTLKKPLALVWTNTSEVTGASEYASYNANLEFYCGPYIYCNKKEITNDSGQPVERR